MTSKRKAISLETKYGVCQKKLGGKKLSDIAKEFELASSTVATILKNSAKIIAEYESNLNGNGSKRNKSAKRLKVPTYQDVDEAVEEWFKQSISNTNTVIGGPEIQAQALKFATFYNHPEFQASNGWLQNFRERNHISFKTIVGEAGLVDHEVTDNYINDILPDLLADYDPRNFFAVLLFWFLIDNRPPL